VKRNIFPIVFLFFIIGFIIERKLGVPTKILIPIVALIFLLNLILFFRFKQYARLLSVSFSFLFILLGCAIFSFAIASNCSYPFNKSKIPQFTSLGRVTSINLIKEDRLKFKIEALAFINENHIERLNFNIQASVYDKNKRLKQIYDRLCIGDTIAVKGTLLRPKGKRNPFEFDYASYLYSKGISALLNIYNVSDIKIGGKCNSDFFGFIHKVRKSIDNSIHQLYYRKSAALLRGLLLADRSEMDYSLRTQFINAGVVHVLAVSGLHVGYILLIFLFLFNRCNIYLRYFLTILGLLSFLLITGMPTSVVRASLMAITALLCYMSGRKYSLLNAVLLSGLIILLFDPKQLFNPGFQLSFSAVLSILFITPFLSESVNRFNIKSDFIRKFLLFLSVSIAAQIGTLPFTLYYFHKLSIVALFANIIVIPLIGIILAVAIISLVFSPINLWLASVYANACTLFNTMLNLFVSYAGNLKLSYLKINQFSIYDSIIYFISLTAIYFVFVRLNSKIIKIMMSILIILSGILFSELDNNEMLGDKSLTIIAIDVSQGDAIFVKTPENKSFLVDCGERSKNFDYGEKTIIPLLNNLGVEHLNYIFISHLDNDHFGGFYSILNKIKVDTVYFPFNRRKSKRDQSLIDSLRKYETPYLFYHKKKIILGNSVLYILNDTTNKRLVFNNRNDNSGVFKYVYGNCQILFTGDLSVTAEKEYCEVYMQGLSSSILKVGHHGSNTSTSEIFLENVSPDIALISVGENNKFGHPSKEVLGRLQLHNVRILRTDRMGAIVIKSDGQIDELIQWQNDW